jgi:hypothetical protein
MTNDLEEIGRNQSSPNFVYSLQVMNMITKTIRKQSFCLAFNSKRHPQSHIHTHTTRQAMYVERNTETRSRNHCCSGKAISVICLCACVCVSSRVLASPGAWACACACVHVALLIQYATRMHHITTLFVPFWLYHNFRHCLITGTI